MKQKEGPLPGDVVCLRESGYREYIYDTEKGPGIPVSKDVMLVIHRKSDDNDTNLLVFVNGGFGWIFSSLVKNVDDVVKTPVNMV